MGHGCDDMRCLPGIPAKKGRNAYGRERIEREGPF